MSTQATSTVVVPQGHGIYLQLLRERKHGKGIFERLSEEARKRLKEK